MGSQGTTAEPPARTAPTPAPTTEEPRRRAKRVATEKRRDRTTTTPPPSRTAATRDAGPSRRRAKKAAAPAAPEPVQRPPAEPTQRAPTTPTRPRPSRRSIEEVASLTLVRREGLTFFQEGRVRGTLNGTMALQAQLAGEGVTATFTVTLPDGSLEGEGEARVKLGGKFVDFTGTASIVKGTGAYAGVTAKGLTFSGITAADGSTATMRLAGHLTEP
jgi:hypothetical protein